MTTFQQFLADRAEQQKEYLKRRAERDEWVAAVGRLMGQVRAWLAEADPDGVLEVLPYTVGKIERGLGMYDAPALKIGLGGREVEVAPVGRYAHGEVKLGDGTVKRADGRVDISQRGYSQIVYRVVGGSGEEWYSMDDRYRPHLFDRARLEVILQDLLS